MGTPRSARRRRLSYSAIAFGPDSRTHGIVSAIVPRITLGPEFFFGQRPVRRFISRYRGSRDEPRTTCDLYGPSFTPAFPAHLMGRHPELHSWSFRHRVLPGAARTLRRRGQPTLLLLRGTSTDKSTEPRT